MLYATKFQEGNILLTGRINDESTILYDRDPRLRLEKVAPWLTVDGNPFPAVVGDRIVWILDGYTTLDSYPYSRRISLEEATSDSRTVRQAVVAQPQDNVNYVRNSVKAVVDAYDGTVTLYEWDEDDPVLAHLATRVPGYGPAPLGDTRRADGPPALPGGSVQDPALAARGLPRHGRAAVLRWPGPVDRPERPDGGSTGDFQPPYYQTIQMPDADQPHFSLTTTYVPQNRQNLAGFMAVNADARSEDYGTIRILRLPGNTQIAGPGQVANDFETDPEVARELSLLRQGDARRWRGTC